LHRGERIDGLWRGQCRWESLRLGQVRVRQMVVWGVCVGTRYDDDFVFQSPAKINQRCAASPPHRTYLSPKSPATVRMPGMPSNDPETGIASESSLLRPAGLTLGGDGIAIYKEEIS
jgi:hypothetical protein